MRIITKAEQIGTARYFKPHARMGKYMLEMAGDFINSFQVLLSAADGSNIRSALVYDNEISSVDNLTTAQKRIIYEFVKEYKVLKQ